MPRLSRLPSCLGTRCVFTSRRDFETSEVRRGHRNYPIDIVPVGTASYRGTERRRLQASRKPLTAGEGVPSERELPMDDYLFSCAVLVVDGFLPLMYLSYHAR